MVIMDCYFQQKDEILENEARENLGQSLASQAVSSNTCLPQVAPSWYTRSLARLDSKSLDKLFCSG